MKKKIDLLVFTILTILFTILVQTLEWGDLFGVIKVACIGCNLLFGLYFYSKSQKDILIVFGLLFTLVADSIISSFGELTEIRRSAALTSFAFVQLCYITLLNKENQKLGKIFIIIRIVFVVLFSIVEIILLKDNYSYMIFIGNFYIVNLLISVIQSFASKYKYKTFSFGLLAFIMCDLYVAIQCGMYLNMISIPDNSFLFNILNKRIDWIFYNISQYLIVITLRKDN